MLIPRVFRGLSAALLLSLGFALGGCSTTPELDAPEGNEKIGELSIVFGHVDMEDAPSKLGWVWMKRMRPQTDTPYFSFWIEDGMFFRANVPPGVYKFDKFGGHSGWKNTTYNYRFPQQGKTELDRNITKPGVYFLGSWTYKEIKTGFWQQDKWDLQKSSKPTELELLKRMLPYAKHAHWKQAIEKRIRELQK